jgi:coproporphyrinogen III oxidase
MDFRDRVAQLMADLQHDLCAGLEALDGRARFGRDEWRREGGGGGVTRVLLDGAVLEKAGVNFSRVHGRLPEAFARELPGSGTAFLATGVSVVLHPLSPHVPSAHMNFRYLEHGERSWFGGGADLTPFYFHAEDKEHFHGVWRRVCEKFADVADYPAWRDACDRYFYLPHRGERRGVGGIFFDHLFVEGDAKRAERMAAFVGSAGRAFLDAFVPIARRRLDTPVTPEQRRWQEIRRGRYVEFNLLHDRGTVFGLRTGGRTESILMSLPPRVRWGYAEDPAPGTPEAQLLRHLTGATPGGTTT